MSRPELHFVIATPQQSINILYIINNKFATWIYLILLLLVRSDVNSGGISLLYKGTHLIGFDNLMQGLIGHCRQLTRLVDQGKVAFQVGGLRNTRMPSSKVMRSASHRRRRGIKLTHNGSLSHNMVVQLAKGSFGDGSSYC